MRGRTARFLQFYVQGGWVMAAQGWVMAAQGWVMAAH